MEEQEEFDFALNEAAVYFDNGNLVVSFGDGRSATMEIESDEERHLVKTVLADANLWASFLGSLSASLKGVTSE